MYHVYVLADPKTGNPRYVGLTKLKPSTRLSLHVAYAKSGKTPPVCYWIRELLVEKLQPIMVELHTTEARSTEKFWIRQFLAEGAQLLNVRLAKERAKRKKNPKPPRQLKLKLYTSEQRMEMSLNRPNSIFQERRKDYIKTKMKAAKKKSVSNPYLRKAANKGRNFEPSPNVEKPTITIKRTKFISARGV